MNLHRVPIEKLIYDSEFSSPTLLMLDAPSRRWLPEHEISDRWYCIERKPHETAWTVYKYYGRARAIKMPRAFTEQVLMYAGLEGILCE